MDKYPLNVSIPRAELARGALGLSRHTDYVIEIDDCGRAYEPRWRRFNSFLWLHGQLRRAQLACVLPELPPKKAVGNLDQAFVERRRQMLQDYLKALLKIPEVIRDAAIWCFLDADFATAAVPRFLCRPSSSPTEAARCLQELKRVTDQRDRDDLFRLCNPAVTADLTAFVRAEADTAIQLTPGPQMGPQQQNALVRMQNRYRLCSVLQPLLIHQRAEAARQGLMEAGLFGALLHLLHRATEDGAAIAAAGGQSPALESGRVCDATATCLQSFIEGSNGTALLTFCQQDGGLEGLRRLAETEALQFVAASLLWHGLHHDGVVVALASRAAGVQQPAAGLQLLARLAKSSDLRAQVLAALCIGCVARDDRALSEEDREECLNRLALMEIPAALDGMEADAMLRGAKTAWMRTAAAAAAARPGLGSTSSGAETLQQQAQVARGPDMQAQLGSTGIAGQPGSFGTAPSVHRGSEPPATLALTNVPAGGTTRQDNLASDTSAFTEVAAPERDQKFCAVLESLCNPKFVPRLQLLLGGDGPTRFDTLSLLVVAMLDHFVRHAADDVAKLSALLPLEPRLCCFVEDVDSGAGSSSQGFGSNADGSDVEAAVAHTRHELRVRAARVLVQMWGSESKAAADPAHEALSLEVCRSRARMLSVLTDSSEQCQNHSRVRLEALHKDGAQQVEWVASYGLAEGPCVQQARLAEFGSQLAQLSGCRAALGVETDSARMAVDSILLGFEQRGIKHGIFKTEVGKLDGELEEQEMKEGSNEEAHAVVRDKEAISNEAQSVVEEGQAELREAEAVKWQADARVHEAECCHGALSNRKDELAEVISNAPANLRHLRGQEHDAIQEMARTKESIRLLTADIERGERRVLDLRDREREAEVAIRSLASVKAELNAFKEGLSNELVLTQDEIDRLKRLEEQLQPARPSRLRRSLEEGAADSVAEVAGGQPAYMRSNSELTPSRASSAGAPPSAGSAAEAAPRFARSQTIDIAAEQVGRGAGAAEADAPVWDEDFKAEKEFRDSPQFRSLAALHETRMLLWARERRWLQDITGRSEADVGRLKLQRAEEEKHERKIQENQEKLRRDIEHVSDHEGHVNRHHQAKEEADLAYQRLQEASRQAAEAGGRQKSAKLQLEQAEEAAAEAAAELREAREAADATAECALRFRAGLERHCQELEEKARQQLHGWQVLEMQEYRLQLLQQSVQSRIASEEEGRRALQAEARRLIEELQRLDRQLDGQPTANL